MAEAERAADGDHEVAYPQALRVPETHGRQPLHRDAQHRDVGVGVGPDQLGGKLAAVLKPDLDLVGAVDHVVVGEHQPLLRIDDHPRSEALALALPPLAGQVEEAAEEGVAQQRVGLDLDLGHGRDVHHRRGYAFQHRRQAGQRLAVYNGGEHGGGGEGHGERGQEQQAGAVDRVRKRLH